MIPLSSDIWKELSGGYGGKYNPVERLTQLYENPHNEAAWTEFWDELHHQNDVGQASYAAVPHILEIESRAEKFNWNGFALIAQIEHCRPTNKPPETGEIADGYRKAWDNLLTVLAKHQHKDWDDTLTSCILSCVAFCSGQRVMAWAALETNDKVARDFLKWHLDLDDEYIDYYAKPAKG